jgi:hypothetical protein
MKQHRRKQNLGLSLSPLSVDEAVSDLLKIKPAHRLARKAGKPRKEEKKK